MRSRLTFAFAGLTLAAILGSGCAAPDAERQYLLGEENGLNYYKDRSTAIEYPIEQCPRPTDPALFAAPRNIRSHEEVPHQKITLDDAVRMALERSEILVEDASFGSPANPLLSSPERVTSIYDTAIQETGFLFGSRGTEAALSEFDTLFTTSLSWGRSEDPQNSAFLGLSSGSTLVDETGSFSTRLEKPLANSGIVSLQHDVNYSGQNISAPSRLFQSAFTGFVRAEYRQPLWAGSGTEFTRIAGPISQQLRGVSGVSQGVLISRINTDISLTQFEQTVAGIVRDVEQRYWDLYLALQLYQSESETLKDTQRFWLQIKGRQESLVAESQARNNLLENEARVKGTLADVLEAEARLRRLLKLPLNDGTFLAPIDVPTEAQLVPDWRASLTEALVYRPELRRQKWNIRSLELQLQAARNVNNPRLDFVSNYSRNMLGNDLFGREDDDGVTGPGYASAYESLSQGLNDTWNVGFQFTVPVGLRIAHAQVQNYEWRLRKSRAVLAEQERDVAYELSAAMLGMQRWYELAESSMKRISSSREYAEAAFERSRREDVTRPESLSLALSARLGQRDAEQAYVRSVVEYNKAITDFQFRQGTLLNQSNIQLAEGEWNQEAQRQALKRAMDRSHALENPELQTLPMEFAVPVASPIVTTGSVISPISGRELNLVPPPVPAESDEGTKSKTGTETERETAPAMPKPDASLVPVPSRNLEESPRVPSDRVLSLQSTTMPDPTRGFAGFGRAGSDVVAKSTGTSGRVSFSSPTPVPPNFELAPASDRPAAGPQTNSKARVRLATERQEITPSRASVSADIRIPNDIMPPRIPVKPGSAAGSQPERPASLTQTSAGTGRSRGRVALDDLARPAAESEETEDATAGRAVFSPSKEDERQLQRMLRSVEKYEKSQSGRFRLGSVLPSSDRKGRASLGE